MQIYTTYSVKIKHYNNIFKDTVIVYRHAVDYLISVCLDHWDNIVTFKGVSRLTYIETLIHATKDNPDPIYDFDNKFYKMPSYLRRGAINEAIGKVSSYKSNLDNWIKDPVGREPSYPKAGYSFPSMYRTGIYNQTGDYTAQIKVYIRNTWDWITINLKKSDMDYIYRHCRFRKQCAPTLQKRGKEWFLDFPFEEKVKLADISVYEQTIVAVDLGINTAATISVMRSDGTILGRHELCKFQNGKTYNCDLSASYNIGARYFIREILKSLDENSRLLIEAKVPQCSKRSTCTFSTLVNLNAEIIAQTA